MRSSSTFATEISHRAEHNARDDENADDDEHNNQPRLQIKAALLHEVTAARIVVKDGAVRASGADQRRRTPCAAIFHIGHLVGRILCLILYVACCIRDLVLDIAGGILGVALHVGRDAIDVVR